jgi:hypothetical protein
MPGLLQQLGQGMESAATRAKNAKAPREGYFSVLDELAQRLPADREFSKEEILQRLKPGNLLKVDDMVWPLKKEEIDYALMPALRGIGDYSDLSPQVTNRLTRDDLVKSIRERRPEFKPDLKAQQYKNYADYQFDASNRTPGSYFESVTDSPNFGQHETHYSPQNLMFSRGAAADFGEEQPVRVIQEMQNDRANDSRRKIKESAFMPDPGADYGDRVRGWVPHGEDTSGRLDDIDRRIREAAPVTEDATGRFIIQEPDDGAAFNALIDERKSLPFRVPDAPFKDPAGYGRLEIKNNILDAIDQGQSGVGITPRSPVGKDVHNHTYSSVYPGELRKLSDQYRGEMTSGEMRTRGDPVIDLVDMEPVAGGRDYFPTLGHVFDPEFYHRGADHPIYPDVERWANLDQGVDSLMNQLRVVSPTDYPNLLRAQAEFRHELQRYTEAMDYRDSMTDLEKMDLDEIMSEHVEKFKNAALEAEQNARHASGSAMDVPYNRHTPEFVERVKKYGLPLFSVAGAAAMAPAFDDSETDTQY